MSLRELFLDYSSGNRLTHLWRLYRLRTKAKHRWTNYLISFLLNRSANRHGGYIGNGARIDGIPCLPHGIHGVYISRYAHIGTGCRIYQNVTIGEVNGKAPTIGDRCLIGANACVIGNIVIGDDVKIGAGAVVVHDVPSGSTVVAPSAQPLERTQV